jgi:hypothetical protein
MYARIGYLKVVLCALAVMILALATPFSVFAQDQQPGEETSCITCHENLYYLHDAGKWYCTCERRSDCVVCHGGQPDALDAETAHAGMFARPIQDNITACQGCHPENYQTFVDRFTANVGVSGTPMPTCAAHVAFVEEPELLAPVGGQVSRWDNPWRWAGLGALTVAFFGLVVFAYFCWKKDCASKLRSL